MRTIFLAFALLSPACITPNVLDSRARAIEIPAAQVVWRAARAEDFRGLFESTSIEGDAALSAWKIYYHFAEDGTYSGAALVTLGAQPQFQTLSGTWKLDDHGLDLGDGSLAHAFAAQEQLKFESEGGTVILRRVAVQ